MAARSAMMATQPTTTDVPVLVQWSRVTSVLAGLWTQQTLAQQSAVVTVSVQRLGTTASAVMSLIQKTVMMEIRQQMTVAQLRAR
jgi:hypothetical protein